MKSLANCKPSEFLRQTNRIRKSVEKWLTDTDIMNIRRRLPEYETAPKGTSAEERKALVERNVALEQEQIKKNVSAILDAVLEEHPDETLEVLALCCFVEPEDADNHPIKEYIGVLSELLNDKEVLSFFTSLARLAQTDTANAS